MNRSQGAWQLLKSVVVVVCASITGCTALTGYSGAKGGFACKAPDGVQCQSMSGVYANAQANNLPGQQVKHTANKKSRKKADAEPYTNVALTTALSSGQPLRTSTEVVRLWIAPWQDSEGDLHDQKFVYLVTDYGTWNLAHTRSALRNNYTVVKPPQLGGNKAEEGTNGEGSPGSARASTGSTAVAKEALETSRSIMKEATESPQK